MRARTPVIPPLGSAGARAGDARLSGALMIFCAALSVPLNISTSWNVPGTVVPFVLAVLLLLKARSVRPWMLTAVTLVGSAATAGIVFGLSQVAAVDAGSILLVVPTLHVSLMRRPVEAWVHLAWLMGHFVLVSVQTGDPDRVVWSVLFTGAVLALLTGLATWGRGYLDRLLGRLRHQVEHDPLTGLLNRHGTARHLERPASGEASVATLLVIDIDHFKRVNDLHGHLAGDEALVWLAGLMRGALPPAAVLARFGGEEFLAVLPGDDVAAGREHAERLRALVATTSGSRRVPFTISVGVAAGPVAEVLDAVLSRADEALYRAKLDGRDRVEVAAAPVAALVPRPRRESTLPAPETSALDR